MIDIIKSTQYYLYDSYSSSVYKIGEENELLKFLSLFYCKIKDDINTNGSDTKSPYALRRCFDFKNGTFITVCEKVEPLVKRYLFFNNDGMIVDVRAWRNKFEKKENVFSFQTISIEKYFENPPQKQSKKKKIKQTKTPTYKKTYLLDTIPEYKEFSKSKNKRYPRDMEKYTKISRSWKDQYKCSRQYSKHKKNRKSTDSIRYYDNNELPTSINDENEFDEYDMLFA